MRDNGRYGLYSEHTDPRSIWLIRPPRESRPDVQEQLLNMTASISSPPHFSHFLRPANSSPRRGTRQEIEPSETQCERAQAGA